MVGLKEEDIHFVGALSYKEQKNPTDLIYLKKLMSLIKEIVKTEIDQECKSNDQFTFDLDISEEDNPHLNFRMNYSNCDDLDPNKHIKLKEKCEELLETFPSEYPFFGRITSVGNYLSMEIRPLFGTYQCPICGLETENSEENYVNSNLVSEEKIVMCSCEDDHNTFFVDDYINQTFESNDSIKVSKKICIHKIDWHERQDRILAFHLNLIAKEEDKTFKLLNSHIQNPTMFIITDAGLPAGYVYWNDLGDKRCLRQIFVRSRFRRKGYATLMIQKTVEIESPGKDFVIETPNKMSIGLLIKSGYIDKDGKGVRCCFCGSG